MYGGAYNKQPSLHELFLYEFAWVLYNITVLDRSPSFDADVCPFYPSHTQPDMRNVQLPVVKRI